MKIGDLVIQRSNFKRNTIGIVAKVSRDKTKVEVLWLKGKYLCPLQYMNDIEVINESR